MPYIELVTNTIVARGTASAVNRELGKLIELIPGKTEQWLMVHIDDQASLCFAGDMDRPAAIVKLKAFGGEQKDECYDSLTRELTELCAEHLGVESERVYVEYETTEHWGWNGANFKRRK